MVRIRTFADADYPRYVDISNRVIAEAQFTERESRYYDESWDDARYFRHRVVALDDADQLAGWAEISHMSDQFHPDKYALELAVDDPFRRRGFGSALYNFLLDELRQRGAISVRAWAKESEPESQRFATSRGFVEARREWQSRLDVAGFDDAKFAGAMDRAINAGITFTSFAAERQSNPRAVEDAYQLEITCSRDVPDIDPYTERTFDDYLKLSINAPFAIPEAFLIAKHGDRYVGLARLVGTEEEPDVLLQALTGIIPEYRGKGIAMALKLQTVAVARALGKREIRTWNDTTNQAMLRINEAMGFVKQPVEILYLKDLTMDAAGSK